MEVELRSRARTCKTKWGGLEKRFDCGSCLGHKHHAYLAYLELIEPCELRQLRLLLPCHPCQASTSSAVLSWVVQSLQNDRSVGRSMLALLHYCDFRVILHCLIIAFVEVAGRAGAPILRRLGAEGTRAK